MIIPDIRELEVVATKKSHSYNTPGIRAYLYDGEKFELSAGIVPLIPEGTRYTTWAVGSCSGIGSLFSFTDPALSIKPGI